MFDPRNLPLVNAFGNVPMGEQDLTPITLNGTDQTITLPSGSISLQLFCDQAFYEGQVEAGTTTNIPRAANQTVNIPVAGRSVWHVKGASGTLRGKVYRGW
ncbi:MAG: hypothetical protein WCI73_10275 [Phycisphaerae bacterium]